VPPEAFRTKVRLFSSVLKVVIPEFAPLCRFVNLEFSSSKNLAPFCTARSVNEGSCVPRAKLGLFHFVNANSANSVKLL
jgi:hypothetical protein